jgi:hypothetical protein
VGSLRKWFTIHLLGSRVNALNRLDHENRSANEVERRSCKGVLRESLHPFPQQGQLRIPLPVPFAAPITTAHRSSDRVPPLMRKPQAREQQIAIQHQPAVVVTLIELKTRCSRNLAEEGEWSKVLGTMLAILLAFAQYYYPHIKASWGGGTPVNVTIYFTKDSAIKPSQTVSVQLVEESDEGFYIVSPKELGPFTSPAMPSRLSTFLRRWQTQRCCETAIESRKRKWSRSTSNMLGTKNIAGHNTDKFTDKMKGHPQVGALTY